MVYIIIFIFINYIILIELLWYKNVLISKSTIIYNHINLTKTSNKLIIFSCFYDSRFAIVRALGVASQNINITCSYKILGKKYACDYKFIKFKKDSAGNSFKLLYMNIIIYLDSKLPIPISVEINNEAHDVIIISNVKERKSLCITTFKQFVSYNFLYQSLKIYRNYGVTHVFIYLSDPRIELNLLKSINRLKLNIIHIHNDSILKDSFYFGQTVKYNDCLYRNMYNSNYIIFADFDELIILNKMNNYNEMFDILGHGDIYYFKSSICPTANYSERKQFHILNDSDINTTLNCCMINGFYHKKYIITTPYKFIKINIHYIDYSKESYHYIYVNETVAYIHHSRIPTNLLLEHCSRWFYDKSLEVQLNK